MSNNKLEKNDTIQGTIHFRTYSHIINLISHSNLSVQLVGQCIALLYAGVGV